MKKVIAMMVTVIMLFAAACAAAETKVNWGIEATGYEVTDLQKGFIEAGYDLGIFVEIKNPDSESKFEIDLIRWTDCEETNYNEAYACQFDKYGLKINGHEGTGSFGENVAICRTHDATCVVNQLLDYLENEFPGVNFEMCVWENK